MSRGRCAIGAVLLLLAGPSVAGAQPAGPDARIGAAWAALGPAARGWSLLVSPAFPAAWPPDGALRRYALAFRPGPGLADGAETAAPWAVLETRPGLPSRLIPLTEDLRPLGVQGVRPMGGEEARLAGRETEVAGLLAAPPDEAAAALIRGFYCGWASRNGVAAGAIMPRHPGFTSWLGCR